MSAVKIHSASDQDNLEVGQIMSCVWPDSMVNSERIAKVLQETSHVTLVAEVEGRVAGFVDGFATTSMSGDLRWEVDLLAVHPEFQNRGIGAALVQASTEAGERFGVWYSRGLIAVGNMASQKAFARCGYGTDGVVCELLVASRPSARDGSETKDKDAHFIRVRTLNYSGLWIEGSQAKLDLQRAINKIVGTELELAGAVVPEGEADYIQAALDLGYEKVGRYQWWKRPASDAS